uniref:argininosuccinate lyase n=1 Tax=Salix viminalis TaxID=40686 RepID=A0A6N2MGI4_SALVM
MRLDLEGPLIDLLGPTPPLPSPPPETSKRTKKRARAHREELRFLKTPFHLAVSAMESHLLSTSPSTLHFPSPKTLFSNKTTHRNPNFVSLTPKRKLAIQAKLMEKENKLWGGRFEQTVTDKVEKFTESISFDKELYKHDIMGSKAHASMLAKQGLIGESDKDSILKGLDEIQRKIEAGEFEWREDREDVHMNIEATLTEMIGEPAKKLHTARSRNDQVLTDFKLWCRDAIDRIAASIKNLQVAMVKLALSNEGLIACCYTHLQRAQPVLLPHLLLAYVEQLERDAGRLLDCKLRMNFCPLGACALAGTGLPIDRFMTSEALGFTAPMRNRQAHTVFDIFYTLGVIWESEKDVSDRDFVMEFLSVNSITAIHLSRLGEEWVLWASEEFGFLIPSDSVSTGSSIMPQKKNPDPMELVRGKSARVIGDLVTLLTLCKGLPLAYNRDLQEDKEPVFDSVKTVVGMLEVSAEFAQNITFNRERIQKSLPAGHLDATTLADYLGLPFRTAHEVVGTCVHLCVSRNLRLEDLTLDDLKHISPAFNQDVYEYLGVENAVNKFSSYGSTGSACVASQLDYWKLSLDIRSFESSKCHQIRNRPAMTKVFRLGAGSVTGGITGV